MNMYMNFRYDPNQSMYENCWHKIGDVKNPSTSNAFVFIDEHTKSIQQSAFGSNAGKWTLFGTLEVDVDQLSGHAAQQRHGVVLRGRPRRIVALGGAKHDCHREETRMIVLQPGSGQRPGFAADVQRHSANIR